MNEKRKKRNGERRSEIFTFNQGNDCVINLKDIKLDILENEKNYHIFIYDKNSRRRKIITFEK